MANKDSIREMYFVKGMNIAEIAKVTHRDRKTVRKLIQQQDWNLEQPKTRKERKGVLKISPYQATIDAILLEDKLSKKKQRHTAKRIYERLLEQCHQTGTEFYCSYRTICLYVTRKKREIYGSQKDFMFELIHQAGEAQADFGDADFKENGKKIQGKYLVLTFPYSNAGYSLMFRGENAECLLTGLRHFFEYVGGVPNRIWFDNPSSMVTKVHKDGERTCTEEFLRFKQHYGFEAVFCNTGSGHEKGNVENKVGYIRRNFLVPIPQITSLQDFNQDLLVKCDEDQEREHYRKEVSLSHLFEEDCAKLLPLPQQPFEVCRYEHVRTNACAKFTLHQGMHTYSVTPRYANSHVLVKLTHEDIIVLDEDLREICRHPRMYGESRQESMDWIPYLSELARRPNALKYTGIYSLLPNPVQTYMDRSSKQDRGSLLKALALMNQELGFERACQVILQAIERNIHDYDSMILLYRKLHQSLPEMKLSGIYDVPMENQVAFSTAVYDEIYPSPTTTSKETRNSSSEKLVTHA